MTAEQYPLTADNKLQKTAEVRIKNTDLAYMLLMLNKLLHDQEWDKIKSTLKSILSLSSERIQPYLVEIIQFTHSCAKQLIPNNETSIAEDIYLQFLADAENLLTLEQYCIFLHTTADQYFNAKHYEIALPYYTQILNLIEKSAVYQSHQTHIIDKITLIETQVRQHCIEKLIGLDKVANTQVILYQQDIGFWYQQRQQLKMIRNKINILTINTLQETYQFQTCQQWHKLFKIFLHTSIKKIVNHLGSPPCIFSFLLAGSYGRADSAIYSDIDPFILIEPQTTVEQENIIRKHTYFDAFIYYLRFHLASLGDNWILGKNKKQKIFRTYQGLHLDNFDLFHLNHADVSQRYLIQTPHKLAAWVEKGFYVDIDELECTSYGLHWAECIYQSDNKINLYRDYLSALNALSFQTYASFFIKRHNKQFIKPLSQLWNTQAIINLKMHFNCPLIYLCWDITLCKCASPFQAVDDSTVLKLLAIWRQQKFLSSIIINLIESAFIFLQALKFEGQSKRNGQPDHFLSPYANSDSNVNDEEEDEDDKADIPLQCLPQLNIEQFNCLTAINGLLQILYACEPEILIQADHAQFDPIKHIINLALSSEPKRWLPLLASLFANFFTEPNDYLPYYRLIPEIHRLSFLEYLQPHFKEHSLYLSIINILNYCPLADGLRPAMLYKQQQWQHQLQLIFKTDVTNKDLKNATRHNQWIMTSYDFENNNIAKFRRYLLHAEINKYLFNNDSSFRISTKKYTDCLTELSFTIDNIEFVAKIEPKFPAISNSINYLAWLILGDGAPENYLCRFQRGTESVVVQFFQDTYKQHILNKDDFANLDLGKLWHRFYNYLDELRNFYLSLFPASSKNSGNFNIPLSETLVTDLWNRAKNLQYAIKLALKNSEPMTDASLIERINQDLLDYYQSFVTNFTLDGISAKKAILSPKQALNILKRLEDGQLQDITNSIKLGNSDGIQQFQLLTPRLQLHLFNKIVQSHPLNENWNDQQLHYFLQAITGVYFAKLDLSLFAAILTEQLFLMVLQNNGTHLIELDISGCHLISQNMINSIAKYCTKLSSLIINQWPEEHFTLNNCFVYLSNLEINDCPKLRHLQLHTPKLQSLHAQDNTALNVLQLNTKQLTELNLTRCISLHEETLMHCLPTFSNLKKVTLKGCKQIHHIKFREKYPYLLGQSFNKHKGKFKENLKIDYRINRQRLATVYHRMKKIIKI